MEKLTSFIIYDRKSSDSARLVIASQRPALTHPSLYLCLRELMPLLNLPLLLPNDISAGIAKIINNSYELEKGGSATCLPATPEDFARALKHAPIDVDMPL